MQLAATSDLVSRASVLLLLLLAGCAAGPRPASAPVATKRAPIESFSDDSIGAAQPACTTDRTVLEPNTATESGATAAQLAQQYTRSWQSTLTWTSAVAGVPASSGQPVSVRIEFVASERVEAVKPHRDPSAKVVTEAPCDAYVELFGTLQLRTDDGRWNASWPASVRVPGSGDALVTMDLPPAAFDTKALAGSGPDAIRLLFFTELTARGAAGELIAFRENGAGAVVGRESVATWQ